MQQRYQPFTDNSKKSKITTFYNTLLYFMLFIILTLLIHYFNYFNSTDMAQNRPLWRLLSTFGAMHS